MTTADLLPFLFTPEGIESSLVASGSAVRCFGRSVEGVAVSDDAQVVLTLAEGDEDHTLDAKDLAAALRDADAEARLFAQEPGEPGPRAVPDSRGIRLHTDHRGVLTLDIGAAIPA